MTPAEERALADEASAHVRTLCDCELISVFEETCLTCYEIMQAGGDPTDVGVAAQIEFVILAAELERRGVIRFH